MPPYTEPLALTHSWSLVQASERLDERRLFDALRPVPMRMLRGSIGRWHCDLASERLTWSDAMYDAFGFPRRSVVTRAEALARYAERSRDAVEQLRAHAIRHRRGFTIDVEISADGTTTRRGRVIAAPVFAPDGRAIAIEGAQLLLPRLGD